MEKRIDTNSIIFSVVLGLIYGGLYFIFTKNLAESLMIAAVVFLVGIYIILKVTKKTRQRSDKSFWPIILSYMLIIHSISCVVYTVNIFDKWIQTPSSASLLLTTLAYFLFVYFSLFVTVISLIAWKKEGFGNLDKIKDHGIIWYLGLFFLVSLGASIVISVAVTIATLNWDNITIYGLIETLISMIIIALPIFIPLGFISGTILGLICEFGKEE
ncbi:hypothetical protein KAS08_00300 [Candidatus Pacearchaeota archaeon]|nr:hypothetical protein [Candidatus Pacearchaeota archaeon]